METQQIRLRNVPKDTVRVLKSKAVLLGQTLEEYLTKLLMLAAAKKKK